MIGHGPGAVQPGLVQRPGQRHGEGALRVHGAVAVHAVGTAVHLDGGQVQKPGQIGRRRVVQGGQQLLVHSIAVLPNALYAGFQHRVAGIHHRVAPEDGVPILLLLAGAGGLGLVAGLVVRVLGLAAGGRLLRVLRLAGGGEVHLGEAALVVDVAAQHLAAADEPAQLVIARGVVLVGHRRARAGQLADGLVAGVGMHMGRGHELGKHLRQGCIAIRQICGAVEVLIAGGIRLALRQGADQLALVARGRVGMGVGRGLLLAADQLPLRRGVAALTVDVPLLRTDAGQRAGNEAVAPVGVGVAGRLLLAADQPVLIAGLPVLVGRHGGARLHRDFAGNIGLYRVSAGDGLLLAADQLPHLGVAAVLVDVLRHLRERTDQHTVPVAEFAVDVEHVGGAAIGHVRVNALHGAHLLYHRHLSRQTHRSGGVAGCVVGVLLLPADSGYCHGDRRQNQCVNCAEHDSGPQTADNPFPQPALAQVGEILGRPRQIILFHTGFSFPKLFYRRGASRRPLLSECAKRSQGPYAEHQPPYDVLVGHAADGAAARVNGYAAVVSHHEDFCFRDLVGKLDVALPQGLFHHIGLVDLLLVDVDGPVPVDVHPVARAGNVPLYQDTVVIVKRHHVPRRKLGALPGDNDIAVIQGGDHGAAVDLEDREPQRGDQHRRRRNDQQRIYRAAQDAEISPPVLLPLQLRFQPFNGRDLRNRVSRRLFSSHPYRPFSPSDWSAGALFSAAGAASSGPSVPAFGFSPGFSGSAASPGFSGSAAASGWTPLMRRILSRYCWAAAWAASNTPLMRRAASAMDPASSRKISRL